MRLTALILVAAAALAGLPVLASANTVALLLSGQGGTYAEVAAAIQAELRRVPGSQVTTAVVDTPAADELANASPQLLITVGTRAAQAALRAANPRVPVLSVLIPRASFEALAGPRGDAREGRGDGRADGRIASETRRFSAVFLDQPPLRQLELVRQALPGLTRVGVVVGPDSARDLERLQGPAEARGFKLIVERVASASELFPALQRVMGDSDVFLALPDPRVISPETAQNLLLTSYRMRAPVVGYSAAYVRAGALIAVYSTPAQTGTQAGEIARSVLRGGALPAPQFTRQFSVSVNRQVARSLGLEIDNESALRDRVARQEAD